MSEYPCIVCQKGDPYSNIICDKCEGSIEHRKEVYENMVALVHDINDIVGYVPDDICKEIRRLVDPIYENLVNIKIENGKYEIYVVKDCAFQKSYDRVEE